MNRDLVLEPPVADVLGWGDPSTRPVGVVVVDQLALFREVARAVVDATAGFVSLGEAARGEDAVELAARVRPDLVLVNVRLPDMSGLDASARLARLRPRPFVVLISSNEQDRDLSGFMPKQALGPRTLRALWERRADYSTPGNQTPKRRQSSGRLSGRMSRA